MRIVIILTSLAILLWELVCIPMIVIGLGPTKGDGAIGVAALFYYTMFLEIGICLLFGSISLYGSLSDPGNTTARKDWRIALLLTCIAFAAAVIRCVRWFN